LRKLRSSLGDDWPQFEKQVAQRLPARADASKLWLMPTTGTKLYRYDGGWRRIDAEVFDGKQRRAILEALDAALAATGSTQTVTWGERTEDRGSQIKFSALGQGRRGMRKKNGNPILPNARSYDPILRGAYPVYPSTWGATSIDVTQRGVEKAYGLK
jgi:hypothetical protein